MVHQISGEEFRIVTLHAGIDELHRALRQGELIEHLFAELWFHPLDFGKLEQHGCFVGSHAVVVLSDQDDIKAVAINLLRFFEDESCGQCTPCRVGCEKAVKLMTRDAWDEALLEELCRAMADASICGLGQAAPNPIRSVLKFFRDDVRTT